MIKKDVWLRDQDMPQNEVDFMNKTLAEAARIDPRWAQLIWQPGKMEQLYNLIHSKYRNDPDVWRAIHRAYCDHGDAYIIRNIIYCLRRDDHNYVGLLSLSLRDDWAQARVSDDEIAAALAEASTDR